MTNAIEGANGKSYVGPHIHGDVCGALIFLGGKLAKTLEVQMDGFAAPVVAAGSAPGWLWQLIGALSKLGTNFVAGLSNLNYIMIQGLSGSFWAAIGPLSQSNFYCCSHFWATFFFNTKQLAPSFFKQCHCHFRIAYAKTVWPSGLRRWLQAPVRKGVG